MKNLFLSYRLIQQKKSAFIFKGIFFGLFFLCFYGLNAQVNYIRTWTATAPEPNPNNLMTRPLSDAKQVTQYFDGLGRAIQTVSKQGSLETSSNANVDLVSMITYDNLGRQNGQYLPYTATTADGTYKTDAFTAQPAFYNGSSPISGQGETGVNAHTLTNFELSPLNRPIVTMAAGNSWVGSNRGIQSGYWTNTITDDVRKWDVTNSSTTGVFGSYTMTGSYPVGTLYKNITTDENGNQSVEFKDLEGKIILKKVALSASDNGSNGSGYGGWICTYYIYDILNNLRAVVQPEGVNALITANWVFNNTILNEQCFRYEYDQRNRMVMKKVPGVGEVYMVYDAVDRLVMTQDANLRNLSKWSVTVYDDKNRPVQTGFLNGSNGDFGPNLSAAYISVSYPSTASGFEILTVTHYDDYTSIPTNTPIGLTNTLQSSWNSQFSATSTSYPYPVMPTKNSAASTQGLVTWSQVEVLGSNGTQYLTTVNIYDDKGRVVQTQTQNYSGGINVNTIQYNWSGQPLVVVQSQQKAGTNSQTTVTVSRMNYDNLNRLLNTTKQIQNTLVSNNALTIANTVSEMQYDVLGQLKTKNLGRTKSGNSYTNTPLETLAYDYNIRGWLLGINRAYVRDVSTANNAYSSGETFTTPTTYSAGNYFGFELGYDKNPTVGSSSWSSSINYNGNITGTIWKSVHDGQIRKYDFTYDAVNRLLSADFNQYTGGSFNKNAGINYTTNNLNYDANGNILTMNQFGLLSPSATSSNPIDLLSYAYISGTNKLQSVSDGANNYSSTLGDFKFNPATKTGTDYTYDANGNLMSDANKGISSIQYNYLNLPKGITAGKGTIGYVYDAVGNKLQKQTIEGSTVTTTLYIGGIVYQNDILQFIPQEEGRIRVNSANNGYIFDYYLKDQIGNTRMTITDDNTLSTPIIDANSYYPFGLTMAGISFKVASITSNKLKFNGKEMQNQEFSDGSGLEMYDFRYRFYDMQLGRFFNQDRLADKFVYLSPYQFCSNNPIWLREIDGLEGVKYTETDQNGKKRTVVEKNVVVLTERTKAIPAGASQKEIDKITKQNARIERANATKLASVKSELNTFYNGVNGKGATDNKGNSVSFKFNVTGVPDINKKGLSEKQIDAAYSKISQENGMAAVSQFDHSLSLTAPASVLTNDFAGGGVLGNTTAARIMRVNSGSPDGTLSHEVSHTLGLSDNGYTSGGILNSPPEQIKSSEVDEILKQAYDKK